MVIIDLNHKSILYLAIKLWSTIMRIEDALFFNEGRTNIENTLVKMNNNKAPEII